MFSLLLAILKHFNQTSGRKSMLVLRFVCVFGQVVMALKYGQGRTGDISISAAVINPMKRGKKKGTGD